MKDAKQAMSTWAHLTHRILANAMNFHLDEYVLGLCVKQQKEIMLFLFSFSDISFLFLSFSFSFWFILQN